MEPRLTFARTFDGLEGERGGRLPYAASPQFAREIDSRLYCWTLDATVGGGRHAGNSNVTEVGDDGDGERVGRQDAECGGRGGGGSSPVQSDPIRSGVARLKRTTYL